MVAAVISDDEGRVLACRRAPHKSLAGLWEFPGGKVEQGESTHDALCRELREEIGIEVRTATPWKTEVVDYPHALVRLHFFKVTAWEGDLHMREAQSAQWETLPVKVHPVLPGTVPVLEWLAQEKGS